MTVINVLRKLLELLLSQEEYVVMTYSFIVICSTVNHS